MKKIIILAVTTFLFANGLNADLNTRVKLLEKAVVKLIDENNKLNNKIQNLKKELNSKIDEVRTSSEINTQMIFQKGNPKFLARVKVNLLNVREKPNRNSKIVALLKKDDKVEIKKSIDVNETIWYQIDRGYISAKYTELVKGVDK